MPKIIDSSVIPLFEFLLKSVKHFGVEQTTFIIKTALTKQLTFKNNDVDFVFKMVCSELKIEIDDVIFSNDKSIKRKYALMFVVYYLHQSFFISFGDLSYLIKRDKSLLYKYYSEIKNLTQEETLIQYKNKFDLLVSEYNINKIN